ncbi:hypothetical protein ATCC90586_007158 [Pythium insidiosum]|nr:hypothetical protein ATCC90586_007158 [Pythium insidiosum]
MARSALAPVGVAVLLLASAAWTVLLAILNARPNATANYLMGTAEFDAGEFWQVLTPPSRIRDAAIVGLAAIALLFVSLSLQALGATRVSRRTAPVDALRLRRPTARRRAAPVGAVDSARERWTVFAMESVELVLQLLTLQDLLRLGERLSLVAAYVALMGLNALSVFYFVSVAWRPSRRFHERMADAILDLAFAVGFPATQLAVAVVSFRGDLRFLRVRQRFAPGDPLMRRARVFSDPVETSRFSTTFSSLQTLSWQHVAVRLLFNALACWRWRGLLRELQQRRAASSPPPGIAATAAATKRSAAPVVPRACGGAFLLVVTAVALYTAQAVASARADCAPHGRQCPLFAYRWVPWASSAACACLLFVDQQLNPSRDEPVDVSAALALLAEAGALRGVQVVNRHVAPSLPRTLSGCHDLRQLVLINTNTRALPAWMAAAFPRLEYLHVEGSPDLESLEAMPTQLFHSMRALHTIVLARHALLPRLPRFDGLTAARTLYLGGLDSVTRLPPLAAMTRLQTLALVGLPELVALPDLAHLASSLAAIHIPRSTALCCNGFLARGVADTSHELCYARCETPGLCFDARDSAFEAAHGWSLPNAATAALLQREVERGRVCPPRAGDADSGAGTRCVFCSGGCSDGRLYQRCDDGICFSDGFDPPTCWNDSAVVEMRRAMIRDGLPCNATDEAWLGCLAR